MHCGGLLAFWHAAAAALNILPERNKSANCVFMHQTIHSLFVFYLCFLKRFFTFFFVAISSLLIFFHRETKTPNNIIHSFFLAFFDFFDSFTSLNLAVEKHKEQLCYLCIYPSFVCFDLLSGVFLFCFAYYLS